MSIGSIASVGKVHKNGSISISRAEVGMFSSNDVSTSGCNTPSFPIAFPLTRTSAQRPGKKVGSVCGGMCACMYDNIVSDSILLILEHSTSNPSQSLNMHIHSKLQLHPPSVALMQYPDPSLLKGTSRSCIRRSSKPCITCGGGKASIVSMIV